MRWEGNHLEWAITAWNLNYLIQCTVPQKTGAFTSSHTQCCPHSQSQLCSQMKFSILACRVPCTFMLHLFPPPLQSTNCFTTITSANFQPGLTGQKQVPALVRKISTENPKCPSAVRLVISLISHSKCYSISLVPLNQAVSHICKAWLVLPSVPVCSSPR